MDRPDLADIERYLDELDCERLEGRRLLEDLANIEDGPETDEFVQARTMPRLDRDSRRRLGLQRYGRGMD